MIDWESYRCHLAFLEKAGLNGILVLGTNGEFGQLTTAERIQLVEATISASTALNIIVGGVVPESPAETMAFVAQLAAYADQLTAVLVAPPFFSEVAAGSTIPEDTVVNFYRQLAGVQDRLLLMLYNVPVPAGGPVTAAVPPSIVTVLSGETLIVGVKDSTARLENIPAYRKAKSGLQVLVGNDHVVTEGLAQGAVGSITACANVFPSAVLTVHQAQSGSTRDAAQAELSRLRQVLELIPGKMVATQKLLLQHLGVVSDKSPVRDQSKELTAAERDQVLTSFEKTVAGLVINQSLGSS
jgi:dihydrodipicolinate synthase/N-acetylneuraminate lyase